MFANTKCPAILLPAATDLKWRGCSRNMHLSPGETPVSWAGPTVRIKTGAKFQITEEQRPNRYQATFAVPKY
jgi:hypothetical protein